MKFAETLSTHLTPEWRKQYIAYAQLKQIIANAIAYLPMDRFNEYRAYIAQFDQEFFHECEKELFKIDSFFMEKHAEAKRKFRELKLEVDFIASLGRKKSIFMANVDISRPQRKTKELKLVLSEFYLSLILLRNYQTLNQTGFRKILKKHDKNFNLDTGAKFLKARVETANFVKNMDIQTYIEEVEDMFTDYLEHGDRSRAMKHLRVPPFEELQSPWRTFRLGFALGLFTCLVCVLYISAVTSKLPKSEILNCSHLHRGSFLLILLIFLIGVNVHGWQKCGVNHVLIFEINPRDHLTAVHLMEIAAYFAVLWVLSFLACLHKSPKFIPSHMFPLIVYILMFLYWFNPIPIQWTSRYWLMRKAGRIVAAPFFPIGFADFWIADQICSLVTTFVDSQFIVCICISYDLSMNSDPFFCVKDIGYLTNAIISSIPSWWRFVQSLRRYRDTKMSFPHAYNAGKYAMAFPVAGLNAAMQKHKGQYQRITDDPCFWGLMISRSISTVYSYLWDVLMDFGVFRKKSGENIFLRNEIIYAPSFYYFAIIEDFLMRWFWVWGLLIQEYKLMGSFELGFLSGIAEIIRRYIWNYIRLENEHVNNVGRFRAVRDISIKLITASDQKDEEED